jgi:NAD(P)-dependent dehydrogenase (short-subunit alcohol dehydrogenase family)
MNNSLFDLTGQAAIVTGTSRGLGQYFARALAKAGAPLNAYIQPPGLRRGGL